MSDHAASDQPPAEEDAAEEGAPREEPSPLRVAMGFFIIPLLLTLGAVGVFLMFGLIAHEEKDPQEYLAEIGGRGINEPWQAAFHLSQQLHFDEDLQGNADLAGRIAAALEDADEQPQVRRYLALALGRIGHPVAIPALIEHTEDPDVEVRLHSVWALGNVGDPEVAPALRPLLQDDDPDVRTMTAYVLGVLDDRDSREALEVALGDPASAVRWNAAVALARMDDPSGLPVLRQMVDDRALDRIEGLRPEQRQQAALAAVRALAHLDTDEARRLLDELVDHEDFKVRQAAREALGASRRSGS